MHILNLHVAYPLTSFNPLDAIMLKNNLRNPQHSIQRVNRYNNACLLFCSYKSLHGMLHVSSVLSEGMYIVLWLRSILDYNTLVLRMCTHMRLPPTTQKAQLMSHPLLHYLTTTTITP